MDCNYQFGFKFAATYNTKPNVPRIKAFFDPSFRTPKEAKQNTHRKL